MDAEAVALTDRVLAVPAEVGGPRIEPVGEQRDDGSTLVPHDLLRFAVDLLALRAVLGASRKLDESVELLVLPECIVPLRPRDVARARIAGPRSGRGIQLRADERESRASVPDIGPVAVGRLTDEVDD